MSSTQLLTLHNNNSSSKNQNNNCWLGFSCFLMPHCHHICCHYLDMCICICLCTYGDPIYGIVCTEPTIVANVNGLKMGGVAEDRR